MLTTKIDRKFWNKNEAIAGILGVNVINMENMFMESETEFFELWSAKISNRYQS